MHNSSITSRGVTGSSGGSCVILSSTFSPKRRFDVIAQLQCLRVERKQTDDAVPERSVSEHGDSWKRLVVPICRMVTRIHSPGIGKVPGNPSLDGCSGLLVVRERWP